MAETYRVGPAKVFVAAAITDPVESWVDLGETRGDVVARMESGGIATGRADQSGSSPRADGVYRLGNRVVATLPFLDKAITKLVQYFPGAVTTTDGVDTALGFGNGVASVSPKAFALVPLDEYTAGSPWWGSESVIWIPEGVARVVGPLTANLPDGDDAIPVFEVELASLTDDSLPSGMQDAGGMGQLHRLLAAGNVGALAVDFLWEAEDGLNPKVGSTGTHTRASTATYIDENGDLQVAASGELRNAHYESGVRTCLLEGQRSNKCTRNYLHGGAITGWSKSGDAAATLTAVTDAAALAAAGLDTVCSDSYVLKLDNSAGVAAAFAVNVGVTGNTNQHTVSAYMRGTGTGYVQIEAVTGTARALTGSYVRYANALTPASSGAELIIRADAGAVVYFVLAQLEEGSFVSSVIRNSGDTTLTRLADVLYFPLPSLVSAPQQVTVRSKHVEKGSYSLDNSRVWQIGAASGTSNPRTYIYANDNLYRSAHHNGTTEIYSVPTGSPAMANTVELRHALAADGAVQLGRSFNAAAEVVGSASAANAFGADWADTRLYVNSAGTSSQGFNAFQQIMISRKTRTLAELRAA